VPASEERHSSDGASIRSSVAAAMAPWPVLVRWQRRHGAIFLPQTTKMTATHAKS
jgi:hypothetical protein